MGKTTCRSPQTGAIVEKMGTVYGHTTVHPLGLAILLMLGVAMVIVKKEHAFIPVLVLACFISPAQRLVVASLDFSFVRIMVVFGVLRMVLRNEYHSFKLHAADKIMIAWAVTRMLLFTVQQRLAPSAFVYQLGTNFEELGIYFVARVLIRSIDDVRTIVKTLIILSFPVMFFFLLEKATGRNVFSIFGGVSPITEVREGRLRVQGAFAHPILAGSFWASIIPMVMAMIKKKGNTDVIALVSFISILTIIVLCSSSTPIIGIMLAFIGMAFFSFRFKMDKVRNALFIGYIALDLSMKAPVYHLLSRIDLAGGSTGHYRYLLIDKAIAHFRDWALWGVPDTTYWSEGTGETLNDIVNQYILNGVVGGMPTLILFVVMIIFAFRSIGRVIHSRALAGDDERFIWGIGASLFTHITMFIVVSYFGQIVMLWNLHLAICISMETIYAPEGVAAKLGEGQLLPIPGG